MFGDRDDKTEKATPKRRGEAREKGRVARSQEVLNLSVLVAGTISLYLGGNWVFSRLMEFLKKSISNIDKEELTGDIVFGILKRTGVDTLHVTLPIILSILIFGIFGNLIQNKFAITWQSLKPQFNRLNPLTGIKRIFSLSFTNELIKSIVKVIIIGLVIWLILNKEKEIIPVLSDMSIGEILAYFSKVCAKLLLYINITLVFIALFDYVYQKWQYERDLMMSKQEVKDELRQAEGDPAVRSKIRSKQVELAKKRMLSAVRTADVVITNPTHLAIALKYEPKRMIAPMVVAKGQDYLALKIREIAKEEGVPIVEDKPLAQTLYKAAEVGEYIPVELYQAVAEVLAYVYRLKGRRVL